MVRLVSMFSMPFCGAITSKYNDPRIPDAHVEGHWAWRRRSARDWNKPEKVWIGDFQTQRRFCREEGLYDPTELPREVEISEDGKKVHSRGMPGSWV
jgi:hypothetical protein